ncbi:DUF1700 domain-containing protein [Limosilactobacillus sp.]|uniref:DUF1700 domain-containing protein n=1 Tax=Limosilactobacillus sp. TaxID=2773925 RepID=UPI0025C643E0|nr:DUF1700 domain-containing protein [Limosilactobacillus sp.]MCH3922126.1 DUF1700 domain-containing protein [Limosilactobacillus sp.]MCH3928897.1 DUF1700 domain-containing protein [Limosilactobacillus sp.]
MRTMNEREKYISELATYLSQLTEEERQDALEFYDEFIADGNLTSRGAIEEKLGTPRQLSRKILADYSIKANTRSAMTGRPASTHSSWRVFWWVLLAIIASPLTFGIGLVAIVVLVAAAACLIGLGAGAVAVVGAFAVAACATLYAGIGLLFTAPMSGLFYLGIGLACVGAFMIFLPLLYWLVRLLAQAVANFAKFIYQKIQARRGEA